MVRPTAKGPFAHLPLGFDSIHLHQSEVTVVTPAVPFMDWVGECIETPQVYHQLVHDTQPFLFPFRGASLGTMRLDQPARQPFPLGPLETEGS